MYPAEEPLLYTVTQLSIAKGLLVLVIKGIQIVIKIILHFIIKDLKVLDIFLNLENKIN